MLDVKGEDKRACGVREVEEEADTKISASDLSYLTSFYGIIGCCNHKIHIYATTVKETSDCLIKEDDVIERRWFSFEDIGSMIISGELEDGKTQLAFYMLAPIKFRPKLNL